MDLIDDIKLLGFSKAILFKLEEILVDPIVNFYNKLSRMAFWAWHMRDNQDWDFNWFFATAHLKLGRMEKAILDNGHHVWQSNKKQRMCRSLLEAKELARRLSEEDLHHKFSMKFHDDYGYLSNKINALDNLFGIFELPQTKLSPKTYRFLAKKAGEKDIERRNWHKERFFYLLNKFEEHWND